MRAISRVLILALVFAGRPLYAEPVDAQAKASFASGSALYEEGKYSEALVFFAKAFEVSGNAEILFNIALCHRNLGDYDKAIGYYTRYLELRPDASDRADVEKKIENLRVLQPKKSEPEPAPSPPSPNLAAPPQTQPESAPLADTSGAQESQNESVLGKWWFWTAIGVVVIGAAAGIAVASSGGEGEAYPAATDGTRDSF
ncbi:MAG: tetratricopeptide repeat protein [Myxococcota bacterium]